MRRESRGWSRDGLSGALSASMTRVANRGVKMVKTDWVWSIVLGPERSIPRLRYYCEVMGITVGEPPEATDLGPGGPTAAALASAVMAGFGQMPAATVRARLGSLRVIVASRLRAAQGMRRGLRVGAGEVAVSDWTQAYTGFFSLEVAHLTHRRFDGTTSPTVRREVFMVGDAVTVLPYDPRRDRVLVIEQMRMGPLGRGDPLPWQIEAIAGRIDPGETSEAAARREAIEEARLVLGALEKVAEYYPTPGAVSEYVYSYVAICDLPDAVAGVFGAAEEAEDIRGLLLPHAALMEACRNGDIANAPLLLTALWLERERPRLRSEGVPRRGI